jgi:hypothetical protein
MNLLLWVLLLYKYVQLFFQGGYKVSTVLHKQQSWGDLEKFLG